LQPIGSQRGSALPIVLAFAFIAMVSVSLYVMGQMSLARPQLAQKQKVQALLNARSAIWWALDEMRDSTKVDTLKTINTLSPDYSNGLHDSTTTSSNSASSALPFAGETPYEIDLIDSAGFGTATVKMSQSGGFKVLRSEGVVGSHRRSCTVRLGARCIRTADTLLYIPNAARSDLASLTTVSPVGEFEMQNELRDQELDEIVDAMVEQLTADTASAALQQPRLVQRQDDFDKLEDQINGPLLIDGAYWDLQWHPPKRRTVVVHGDLQLTGTVLVENVDFVVAGEIKILDKVRLRDVALFTMSKIFIGDAARFNGDALALKSITVYGDARVEDKSTLVVKRKKNTEGAALLPPGAAAEFAPPPVRSPKSVVQGEGEASPLQPFDCYVSERAYVDGTIIVINGGMKTGSEAVVSGVLYVQMQLCHYGTVYGVIKAGMLVDCEDPAFTEGQPTQGMRGTIQPYDAVTEYRFPSFMGTPTIISWEEN
jgi:hypothetical protein